MREYPTKRLDDVFEVLMWASLALLFIAVLSGCGGSQSHSGAPGPVRTEVMQQFATGIVNSVVFFPADNTHPDETIINMVEAGQTAPFYFTLCGDVRDKVALGVTLTIYASISSPCSNLQGVK